MQPARGGGGAGSCRRRRTRRPPPAAAAARRYRTRKTSFRTSPTCASSPAPELAREHDAARQAYGRARSDYNRVRLAMVVALPNTSFYDEPRALDLLDPIAKNAESRLSGLASLLVSQIQERRRLDANAQALQQKLDALKSLERSLIERKR